MRMLPLVNMKEPYRTTTCVRRQLSCRGVGAAKGNRDETRHKNSKIKTAVKAIVAVGNGQSLAKEPGFQGDHAIFQERNLQLPSSPVLSRHIHN